MSEEIEVDSGHSSGNPTPDAVIQRAKTLIATDPESSFRILEAFLLHEPDSLEALRLAANALMRMERREEAIDYLNLALHYHPRDVPAVADKVRVLLAGGEVVRATNVLLEQFAANPGAIEIGLMLARQQYSAWDYEGARDTLEKIFESSPLQFEALNFLGLILAREFGDLNAGRELIAKALEVRPGDLSALSNLGWILAEQGLLEDAMVCFDRVLADCPSDSETRLMRAFANLKHGRYREGWPDFEARFASAAYRKADYGIARVSLAAPILGKRLLVSAEQGLGDQIMFASCLEDLRREALDCVIECDSRLVSLFRRSFPGSEVLADSSPAELRASALERHGVANEIAMGSLPGRYRLSRSSFPAHEGYLKADPEKIFSWRQRLEKLGTGPKIGISWQGGAASTRRQLRSVSAGLLVSAIPAGAKLISLQYGVSSNEVKLAGSDASREITHWPESIADYEETAALISSLDLIISVCTAVVHLAGALGKRVWVLTPAIPEWRYQISGDEMPWYPGVRLFRQGQHESWREVVERVGTELAGRTF